MALPSRGDTPYDIVEYSARPRLATHPDQLATIATLFALSPPEPAHCRVLEVGCSDGGNLISMALTAPESSFIGVDYAATSIEEGQRAVASLGLQNVELRCCDLLDIEPELGAFDYIIAHGVYSWVPKHVREKLLALCKRHLSARGVAFVSYNTYPGCLLRRLARDMLLFHTRDIEDPAQRIQTALDFLARVIQLQPAQSVMRAALEGELRQLARVGTSFVFHDVLAAENQAFYFEAFAADAARAGLMFLSEAQFFESYEAAVQTGLAATVPDVGHADIIRAEQYLDFLKARSFRQTLLVHEGSRVDRALAPERVAGLFAGARLRKVQAAAAGNAPEEYESEGGLRVKSESPVAARVFEALTEAWPCSVSFADLEAHASGRGTLEMGRAKLAQAIGAVLIRGAAAGVIELAARPSPFTTTPGERPLVSQLLRFQARTGGPLSSLRHASISVDLPLGRELLCLMDGTRTRSELKVALRAAAEAARNTRADGGPGCERRGPVRHAEPVPAPDMITLESIDRLIAELAELAVFFS